MTWEGLIRLILSKKRAKNQFPDTRRAGYLWLSQCTVALTAFWKCVFFGTPCRSSVKITKASSSCFLSGESERADVAGKLALFSLITSENHIIAQGRVMKIISLLKDKVFYLTQGPLGVVQLIWWISSNGVLCYLLITPLPACCQFFKLLTLSFSNTCTTSQPLQLEISF